MRILKKTIALILIFSIIYTINPSMWKDAFAAPLTVNVSVSSYIYGNGTLTIKWDALPNTQSVVISYHTFNTTNNTPEAIEDEINTTTNTATLSAKLKNDYIYDIHVEIYNEKDGAGNMIGEGFLYFLPQITFYSKIQDQPSKPISGGGQEIGLEPKLNLRWRIPMVYSDTTANGIDDGDFILANTLAARTSMENSFSDGREINTLNFRINISTDVMKLNAGSAQSAVLINDVEGTLQANVSNKSDYCTVKEEEDNLSNKTGFVNFDLLGRSDPSATLPNTNPAGNTLSDGEILPGTVYYMNIKPVFKDSDNRNVNVLTVGPPPVQNGSLLTGIVPYAYTPIRFQLTKDSVDNLYVKIFKINKGSLDLPRLYYEVQASDDPSIPGDWSVKKTIDDSFFASGSESALTVITGTNPNNEIYYKIVVKSDSPIDRIDSLKLPYTLADDTARPPLPKGVAIGRKTPVTQQDAEGNIIRSTDLTVSWEKPSNWDAIKNDPNLDIVYHFMFSTFQTELTSQPYPVLESEGKAYGNFPLKYRMQKYVNALSPNVIENGNRLEYTIKGFSLYQGEYIPDPEAPDVDPEPIPHEVGDEEYPEYLLPNKAYYVQMYTTTVANRGSTDLDDTSDKSIIASATTVIGSDREAPLPANFKIEKNAYNTDDKTNYIELLFNQVSVNWSNYTTNTTGDNKIFYDLYMSTRPTPNSFVFIGSTDPDPAIGVADVTFSGLDQPNTPVKALIQGFKPNESTDNNPKPDLGNNALPYSVFGSNLRQNTTYYFIVRTRLVIDKAPDPDTEIDTKVSIPTAILPVTTVVCSITEPDPKDRNPLAPTDFAIAKDSKGNLILSGSNVTFNWKMLENGVSYEIIRTSERLAPESSYDSYKDDPLYMSYTMDPTAPMADYTYEAPMNEFTVKGLFPNSLYYFSIRAISKTTENTSPWVCIPVTTLLISSPTALEPVNDAELGFSWSDSEGFVKAEDYKVYLKGPNDRDFKLLTNSQVTVTKSKDGLTYFGRIKNLQANTTYDVKVSRKGYEEVISALSTRDKYHEIEVKWKGILGSHYELAIKSAQASEYTTLLSEDLEEYINWNSNTPSSYYIEESPQAGPKECYFYARIKTMQVKLPDDSTEQQPLKSNTRYYIKARTVQVDPSGLTPNAYSKYVEPATTRTEFSQSDYDNDDNDKKDNAKFLDKISKLEEDIFWRLSIRDKTKNSILLKGDRVVNSMQNNGRLPFTVDISTLAATYSTDIIYMPADVVQQVNSQSNSLIIKTVGAEFTLRPYTLNLEKDEKVNQVNNNADVKDMLVKLTITRKKTAQTLTSDIKPISDFHTLAVQAIGTSMTYATLKEQVHDKLYNVDTGLVVEKSNKLMSELGKNNSRDLQNNEKYINDLIEEVKDELSDYISDTISSSFVPSKSVNVVSFDAPLLSKIFYTDKSGSKLPYVKYDGETRKKISTNLVYSPNAIAFNAAKTGEYAIMLTQGSIEDDIQPGFDAKDDINGFMLKYNLKDIFGSYDSIYPDSSVAVKDIVLLYEKIVGNSGGNIGLDIKQKAKKLGLDTLINATNPSKNVLRQETAGVLIKLYSLKLGVSPDTLKTKKNIFIEDDSEVGNRYYKAVILCIDTGIMPPRSDESFAPNEPVTKSEMLSAFVRVLKMTGDM